MLEKENYRMGGVEYMLAPSRSRAERASAENANTELSNQSDNYGVLSISGLSGLAMIFLLEWRPARPTSSFLRSLAVPYAVNI